MKIVIIGPAYPYRGGIALFTERLAQQFIEEKHEVEIITFTLQYPSFLFPGKTQFSDSDSSNDLTISRKINSINPFPLLCDGKSLEPGDNTSISPALVKISFPKFAEISTSL